MAAAIPAIPLPAPLILLLAVADPGFAKGRGADHGESRARVYNRVWGGELPGSRGRASGGGQSAAKSFLPTFNLHTKEGPRVNDLNDRSPHI